MNQPANEIRTLCHHILPPSDSAPAHTCGSPALRGESFCFYHHPTRTSVPSRADQQARLRERRLPAAPSAFRSRATEPSCSSHSTTSSPWSPPTRSTSAAPVSSSKP